MVRHQHPVSTRLPGATPVRTCVGCRARVAEAQLLRVVHADGALVPDPRRRMPGRGAWVHPDPGCLAKAEKRRAFPRALRVQEALDVAGLRSEIERIADGVGTGYSRPVEDQRKQVDPS
ncbi:YlxR family protein [Actinokineospora diospyrosa]|uniref:YlxR family protein n=1 Tax=Actinokineospora diospyrosa TaxID=103728 RepID=UPI0020A44010|nr:YlxR family protein [Actinokineospora diospyrosa]